MKENELSRRQLMQLGLSAAATAGLVSTSAVPLAHAPRCRQIERWPCHGRLHPAKVDGKYVSVPQPNNGRLRAGFYHPLMSKLLRSNR